MVLLCSWGANIQELLSFLECWRIFLDSEFQSVQGTINNSVGSSQVQSCCWRVFKATAVSMITGVVISKQRMNWKLRHCRQLRWLRLGQILYGRNFGKYLWPFPCSSTRCLKASVAQDSVDLMGFCFCTNATCGFKELVMKVQSFLLTHSTQYCTNHLGPLACATIATTSTFYTDVDVGGLSTGMFLGI